MEKKIKIFVRFVSMEMVAMFDFRALTKVHNNIKIAPSKFKYSETLHTHRGHINEE